MPRRKKESKPKVTYAPTPEAFDNPRYFVGATVNGSKRAFAIGGEVTLKKRPPKLSVKIPKASQEELKWCFEKGMTHLVRILEGEE